MVSSANGTADDDTARADAASVAASLGVVDSLVFRRIGTSTWAHLGGLGRGSGWAGIIDIDETSEPLAFRIPSTVGEVYRKQFAEPSRMIGPYYTTDGAVIRVSNDVAVVLGNPGGSFDGADDAELLHLAYLIDSEIDDVHPSKRLADELEILTTVRELMDAPIDCGLAETIRHLLAISVQAMSCDIGVLRDRHGTMTVFGDTTVSEADWNSVLDDIEHQLGNELWCAQDMSSPPSRHLHHVLPAARSMLATQVPPPVGGCLLMIHTAALARGFTKQCQRICRNVLETGTIIARTAMLRDDLRTAADRASAVARTDPLTGLGNRLAWDEAIAQAQEQVDGGRTYSVITVDIDGLKFINDHYGHNAGDDLLRRCADVIREHCSDIDIAVRMGGDEFAILVPKSLGPDDSTYVAFAQALSGLRSTRSSVAASLGICTAYPGDSLFDAARDADMQMYSNKQERRRQLALQEQA